MEQLLTKNLVINKELNVSLLFNKSFKHNKRNPLIGFQLFLFCLPFFCWAQWNPNNPLMVSPEDCPLAMRICDATQEYNFQLSGDGLIDDANGSLNLIYLPRTSPTQFESKICFLKFTPQYSGDLSLIICPETLEGMQFQIFKNYSCTNLNSNAYASTNSFVAGSDVSTWSSDRGCMGLGAVYNPYNPGNTFTPNFTTFLEPLESGLDYLIIIQIRYYLQSGTHRFTLRFAGPAVLAHPDLFNHPECTMSAEEILAVEDYVSVSPNPFTNELTIKSPIVFEKVKLYDVSGKLINEQNYQPTITVTNLSQGVYFLHLLDHTGKQVVRKVVRE